MPNIPLHVSALFIALVFGIAFLVLVAVYVCSARVNLNAVEGRKNFAITLFVLLGWLMITLVLALSGYLDNYTSMPPRILLVTLPPLFTIIALMFSKKFNELIEPVDNFWFIYPQSFRLLMEFILWLLYRYHVIPVQMTFEGRNYDVLIGLTAPIIAYYCFNKKTWSPQIALVWNFAGLALLGNIVGIAIFSTPYPFRMFMNEPANTVVFHFPFVWLPSVVVPFAFLLHLLSIKRLWRMQPDAQPLVTA